jgi:lysophospholipase L1-like esterase
MKNTKFLSNMTVFALSCLLSACNPTVEPTPDVNTFVKSDLIKTYELGIEGQNYALVGDTTLPKQETTLDPAPSKPNLISISTKATFKYVAIGASLTAGVRDGGWTNDGMLTSYPNLIARQMGITDFKQPLFNDKEFNGYGLKLQTTNTETPVPRYKAVSNNLAFKPSGVEMILTPYEGTELNNFAVPNLMGTGIGDNLNTNDYTNKYYKLYLKRILNDNRTINEQVKNSNATFFSIEYYLQDIMRYALSSGIDYQHLPQINYPPFDFNGYTGATDGIIGIWKEKGLKNGIILNVPNILNFPFFKNCTKYSSIKLIFDKHKLTNKDYGYDINDDWVYFPNASLDTLFKYQNDKTKFLDFYLKRFKPRVLLKDTRKSILEKQDSYSKHIEYVSKKYAIPIVDIASLYEQVSNSTYISDDGRKVTDKEFFSSDGLYPSAYGQAIIANECIKTINAFYKTNITLIKTDFYLKK